MAATLLVASEFASGTTIPQGQTRHGAIANTMGDPSDTALRYQRAGTFSYARVVLAPNTTITATFLVNGVAGNQFILALFSGGDGEYLDSTHTDVVNAGDTVVIQVAVAAGASNSVYYGSGAVFRAGGTTVAKIAGSRSQLNTSDPDGTLYWEVVGGPITPGASEGGRRVVVEPTTIENFFVSLTQNTRNQSMAWTSRINSADGTQTLTITASTTGIFEDTTHTDAIDYLDEVNAKSVSAVGTGNITLAYVGYDYHTTTGTSPINNDGHGSTSSTGTFFVMPPGGPLATTSLPGNSTIGFAATVDHFHAFVVSNTRGSNVTLGITKNNATTTIAIVVAAGLTGWFNDTTHTVDYVAADTIAFRSTTGSGPGSYAAAPFYARLSTGVADDEFRGGIPSGGVMHGDLA